MIAKDEMEELRTCFFLVDNNDLIMFGVTNGRWRGSQKVADATSVTIDEANEMCGGPEICVLWQCPSVDVASLSAKMRP